MGQSRFQSPAAAARKSRLPWRLARGLGVLLLTLGILGSGALAYFGSDAKLTALAQAQLAHHLAGNVQLGRLHWGLPLHVTLDELVVRDSHSHSVTLCIPHAEAHVHLGDWARGAGLGAGLHAAGVELAVQQERGHYRLPFLPQPSTSDAHASQPNVHATAPTTLKQQLERLPRMHLLPSTIDIRAVHLIDAAEGGAEIGTHSAHGTPHNLIENVQLAAIGRGNGQGTLSASLSLQEATLHMQSRVAVTTAQAERTGGSIALHAQLDVDARALTQVRDAAHALGVARVRTPRVATATPLPGHVQMTLDLHAPLPQTLGELPPTAHATLGGRAESLGALPLTTLSAQASLADGVVQLGDTQIQLGHNTLALDGAIDVQQATPTRMTAVWHATGLRKDAHQLVAALNDLAARCGARGELAVPSLVAPLQRAATTLAQLAPRLPHRADAIASVRPSPKHTRQHLDVAVASAEPSLRAELHAHSASHTLAAWAEHDLQAEGALAVLAPQQWLGERVPAGARSLRVQFSAQGRAPHLYGRGEASVDDLFVIEGRRRIALGQLSVPLNLRPEALEVRPLTLRGPEAHLDGEMLLAPPTPGAWREATLAGEVHVRELGPTAQALGIAAASADIVLGGDITAPLVETRLAARLAAPAQNPSGAAQKHAAVPVAAGADYGDVHITALGHFAGTKASLRALSVRPSAGGQLSATGELDTRTQDVRLSVAAHNFALPGRDARLELGLVASGSPREGLGIAAQLSTLRSRLEVDGRLHTGDEPLSLALAGTLDAHDVDAFLPPSQHVGAQGTADIRGTLTGTAHRPDAHLAVTLHKLALARAQLGEGPLQLEASLTRGTQVVASLHDDGSIRAQLKASRASDAWRVDGALDELRAEAWLPPLRSTVAALRLAGSGSATWGPTRASRHAEVSLTRLHISAHQHGLDLATPTTLDWRPDALRLSPLRLNGSAGHVVARAAVGTSTPAVAAQGQLELGLVAPFVPALAEATGRLAFDAEVGRDDGAMAGRGSVRVLTPLWVRPRGSPTELRLERGEVRLSPTAISLHNVDGSLEGGSFHVAGAVGLDKLRPTHWDVAVRGAGLPLHASDLLLETNLKLALRGPGDAPTLSGDVEIVGGRYLKQVRLRDFHFVSREVDTQSPLALRAPWLGRVALDVRAKSPAGVEIAVDAGAFAARTTLVADVRVGGNLLAPKLGGKIQASEGRLHFPRGDLQLTGAQVDFEPSRRTRSEPLGAELALQAEGEVHASGAGNSTAYLVTLRLDGTPKSLALDLSCDQGLSQLEVLSLLTTGHVNVSDLAQGDQDQSKLDAALALAGSQLSQPVTRFAEDKLEQALDLQLELGMELAGGNMRLTAAKNVTRRLRLESAYSHAIAQEQSNVAGRALLSLTDRLLLEGVTARDLTGPSTNASQGPSMQSNLELKYRVVGH